MVITTNYPNPNLTLNMAVQIVNLIMFDVCSFDLILYIPSTIFQLRVDGSSWVEPVLS